MPINFYNEDIDFKLAHSLKIKKWISRVISLNKAKCTNLNIVFCSDEYLYSINKQHLKHDYYTDIITFDNSEQNGGIIEADMYISIERVRDNAVSYSESFNRELYRVIIHGILHLLGYNDKTEEDLSLMRRKEDEYLDLLPRLH